MPVMRDARIVYLDWKQKTPHDQLTVLLMSLQGHLDNFKEGIIDKDKFAERADEHLNQLRTLQVYLKDESLWPNQ